MRARVNKGILRLKIVFFSPTSEKISPKIVNLLAQRKKKLRAAKEGSKLNEKKLRKFSNVVFVCQIEIINCIVYQMHQICVTFLERR